MSDLTLALDIGTTSVSCVLFDGVTSAVCQALARAHEADLPSPDGHHEQDPERIVAALVASVAELWTRDGALAARVGRIAITGQMHGVLLVGADGRYRSPLITWRDTRSRALLDAMRPGLEPHAARTGCHLHAGYGGATLAWLAAEGELPPDAVALPIAGDLARRLTENLAVDHTHAASWGLCDIRAHAWLDTMSGMLGIPAGVLPPIIPAGTVQGVLMPEMASRLGLRAGIPVHAPVGDNQASYAGACGEVADGIMVVNLGTGGQVSIPTTDAKLRPGLETRPLPTGGFILVGATLSAGWAHAYWRKFLSAIIAEYTGSAPDKGKMYAMMDRLAAQACEDAGGLVFDTRFLGTRADPSCTGALSHIDTVNLTPANTCRALLAGVIEELAGMAEGAGMGGVRSIRASGNMARHTPLVPEIIASRFGCPCTVSESEEEAATGAALYALAATNRNAGA